eukprot:2279818-Rhodomonas_salina.1
MSLVVTPSKSLPYAHTSMHTPTLHTPTMPYAHTPMHTPTMPYAHTLHTPIMPTMPYAHTAMTLLPVLTHMRTPTYTPVHMGLKILRIYLHCCYEMPAYITFIALRAYASIWSGWELLALRAPNPKAKPTAPLSPEAKRCIGLTWGAGASWPQESFRSWGPWCHCKQQLPSGVGCTVVVKCRLHVTLPSPAPIL